MLNSILELGLAERQIQITDKQLSQFLKYMELVLSNNQKVNLTAITDPIEFHVKHYLDSIDVYGTDFYDKVESVIDVGTGGGFPGVPLAILSPEKKFVLMDSLRKRMDLVREMCEECGITNVEVIHARAEELAKEKTQRESYDLCVSRAVANLSVLSEYCLPFVKVDGRFVSYKAGDCMEEIHAAEKAIHVLGGELEEAKESEINGQRRTLVIIRKQKSTPAKYPRKPGTPSKTPIR